jgi:hypothetical protein
LNYEITVTTGEGVHHVAFDDMTMPEEVAPLLEYLQGKAKPQPLS